MSTSDYRTAGIFLLLTALATAISVPARLAAGADDTPFTDSLSLAQNLDAVRIAQLETTEKLGAIAGNKGAYGVGGAARLVGGLMLMAAGFYLWRAIGEHHPTAMAVVAVLLAVSGIASAISGASAVALAVMSPELQATRVYTYPPGTGWDYGAEQALFTIRWLTGTIGFTLAGLGLVALAPVQWRMGGILRVTAMVDAVLGVAMLFIWLDAATVVHRITGIAFLIWLILVGLWLVVPRLRTIGAAASSG